MKFKTQVTVVGMKASKGDYEGTAYDSTKAYLLMEMDESKDQARGMAVAEFKIGDSTAFAAYRDMKFPLNATAEFEMLTTGKQTRMNITGLQVQKA